MANGVPVSRGPDRAELSGRPASATLEKPLAARSGLVPLRVVVFIAFAAALLFRFLAAGFGGPIANDAAAFYLPSARALIEGGLGNWDGMTIAVPPLFPTLVAILYPVFGDLEYTALAISIVASAATIFPIVGIARELFPGAVRIHALTALIGAAQPFAIRLGGDAKADALYALAFATSLWLGIRVARRPSALIAIGFGFATGVAYLLRPEALGLWGVAGLAFVILCVKRADERAERLRRGIPAILAAVVTIAPLIAWNMAFVHARTGVWTLSPKAAVLQDYDKGLGDPLNALNADRTMTLHEEMLSREGELPSYSPITAFLENPGPVATSYLRNLLEYAENFPKALGIATSLLFLLGLVTTYRVGDPYVRRFLLGTLIFYGLALSLFYISRRFWLPLIPAVLPVCGAGAIALASRLERRFARPTLAVVVIAFIALVPEGLRHGLRSGADWFSSAEKRLGRRIADSEFVHSSDGPLRVVSAKGRVAFYADAESLPLPSDPLPAIAEFMANREVSLIVLDFDRLRSRRPELVEEIEASDAFTEIDRESNHDVDLRAFALRR